MTWHALQDVASGVPKEELERAKLAAMSSVYMNLESRAVVAEDIGRQILTFGHRRALLLHWGCAYRTPPFSVSFCVW